MVVCLRVGYLNVLFQYLGLLIRPRFRIRGVIFYVIRTLLSARSFIFAVDAEESHPFLSHNDRVGDTEGFLLVK